MPVGPPPFALPRHHPLGVAHHVTRRTELAVARAVRPPPRGGNAAHQAGRLRVAAGRAYLGVVRATGPGFAVRWCLVGHVA